MTTPAGSCSAVRVSHAGCSGGSTEPFSNPIDEEVAMTFKGLDQFGKCRRSLPLRAGYCVDCLSQLYGLPVEGIRGYLGETGITSRQAHRGNCGEHHDTFMALLLRV
jgi:hypothetical protein